MDFRKLFQRQETCSHCGDVQCDRTNWIAHRVADLSRRRCALLLPWQQSADLDLCPGTDSDAGTEMVAHAAESAEGEILGDDG